MGPIIPVPCTYFLKALQEELKEKLGALESPGPCVFVFLATVPTVQRGDGAPCPPAQPSPAQQAILLCPSHAMPILSTSGDRFPYPGTGRGYLVIQRLLGNTQELLPGEY